MATKIVHFGADECARIALLSGMGYDIHACGPSVTKLREALSQDCNAIAIEGSDPESNSAAAVAREISAAPLVFFEGLATDYNPSEYDLVVRSHTPPGDWLPWLAKLITESYVIRSESSILREQSARVREESKSLREQSRAMREEAARMRRAIRQEKDESRSQH